MVKMIQKKSVIILSMLLCVALLLNLVLVNNTHALSTRSSAFTTEDEIHANFPESYWEGLDALLEAHPTWKFVKMDTDLTWDEVLQDETEYLLGRNLVGAKNAQGVFQYPTSWYAMDIDGAYSWTTNSWTGFEGGRMYQASKEAIQYCMDPRNFFTDEQIFQFMDIFTPADPDIVEDAVQNIFVSIGVPFWTQTAENTGIYDDVTVTDPDYATKHAQYLIDLAQYQDDYAQYLTDKAAYDQYLLDLASYEAYEALKVSQQTETPSTEAPMVTEEPQEVLEPNAPIMPTEPQETEEVRKYYTYGEALTIIGTELGINQLALAARVRQEHGAGTSQLISGTYSFLLQDDQTRVFGGYYNYFNINASGNTMEEIYRNGMLEAYSYGWDTRYKALKGGAQKYKDNNIEYGRETLYLQKFNVDTSKKGTYWAQYMQNITAPQSESRTIYNSIVSADALETSYTFVIPVFKDMPETTSAKPTKDGNPNYKVSSIYVDDVFLEGFESDTLSYELTFESETTSIDLRALTYADTTVITVSNTVDEISKDVEVQSSKMTISDQDYGYHTFTVNLEYGENEISILSTAENGDTRTYKITVTRNGEAELCDVNYDGEIDVFDITNIRSYILNYIQFSDKQKSLADANNDGEVDVFDITTIRSYILGYIDKPQKPVEGD